MESRYSKYNANPHGNRVGDCTVRAISKATGNSWDHTYIQLMLEGYDMKDMPTANHVWGSYLYRIGFRRHLVPDRYPNMYTVEDFCNDHLNGNYVLALPGHVIAVVDGNYYDTWDSGNEVPVYYWEREK